MAGYDYCTGITNNGNTTRKMLFLSSPLPAELLLFSLKMYIVIVWTIFQKNALKYRSIYMYTVFGHAVCVCLKDNTC